MEGANVDNVKVFGRLGVRRTVFRGNIRAEPGHASVQLFTQGGGNTVQGNVRIKGGVGPRISFVGDAVIQGNLRAEENSNGLTFEDNLIGGDLEVSDNTGVAPRLLPLLASASIGGNTIGGDLECEENSPPPSVSPTAGPNTVGGDKEDQCSADLGF